MSLHKFYFTMWSMLHKHRELRYGQAAFNLLVEVKPNLAEEVRGTNRDPFFVKSPQDERWDAFVDYIEENWYK